jgi:metaxin
MRRRLTCSNNFARGSLTPAMMPDQDSTSTLFPIPPVVRKVFDSFPLLTYPATPLPTRCPRPQSVPTLYVFSTPEDAASGRPSFNPSCLKWQVRTRLLALVELRIRAADRSLMQAFLRLCGIRYRIVPSNNHASPSGALPFLIPASKSATPVPGNRLSKWTEENGKTPQSCDLSRPEVQAFLTLIDTKVRDAWVCPSFPRSWCACNVERPFSC